jgi:vacuolar protein sorting-associated protein 13A/C
VQVEVAGRLAKQLSAETQGMATRAVPVQVSFVPSAQAAATAQQGLVVQPGQAIRWNERFVLALPPDLAEQLLMPAPGDNPFDGIALELKVSVFDGAGERGVGRVLSTARVPVTFAWLLSQTQALLAVRTDAAAAAGAATANQSGTPPKPPLPASQQQLQSSEGVVQAAPADAHAAAAAGEAAGCRAAAEAAGTYGLGRTYVIKFDKSPADAAGSSGQPGSSSSGDGPGDSGDTPASSLMQLTLALSLDDSQVASSWRHHQMMRSKLARTLRSAGSGISISGGSAQQSLSAFSVNLTRPSSQRLGGSMSAALTAGGGGGAGRQRNALRLDGSDVWSPFSYTSLQRVTSGAAGSAAHTGAVPIRAGLGLVLELSYTGECCVCGCTRRDVGWHLLEAAATRGCLQIRSRLPPCPALLPCPANTTTGGQYHGRIRSLCQFFNATGMLLEVALLDEDDAASWLLLPLSASSSAGASQQGPGGAAAVGDVIEEEVFEYERYLPLRGWSPDHLKGLDPRRYSRFRNGSHSSVSFPKVQLPQVRACWCGLCWAVLCAMLSGVATLCMPWQLRYSWPRDTNAASRLTTAACLLHMTTHTACLRAAPTHSRAGSGTAPGRLRSTATLTLMAGRTCLT